MGTEVNFDPARGDMTMLVNASDVDTLHIADAFDRQAKPLIAELIRWSKETRLPTRTGTMFDRDRYLAPPTTFEQIRVARDALSDDVVGTVADSTESLVFKEVDFWLPDLVQKDLWNQYAGSIELDALLRSMWRQLFTDSQVVVAMWWGRATFRYRGRGEKGNPSRKVTTMVAPVAFSIIDTLKVVPIGSLNFGRERLAYVATREEAEGFDRALGLRDNPLRYATEPGVRRDETVERLIVGHYRPDKAEQQALREEGVDTEHLYEMDPNAVWRHTLTRSHFERFARVRMVSAFAWLDIKHQLQQMDRAHLIGGPLRVDQRIATPSGWKPIGAAQVGDQVFGVDGRPARVVGVYPQGQLGDLHRVTFTDGAEVVCDLKHPWTVVGRSGRTRTIPLSLIMEEGLYEPNGRGRLHRHRIPIAAPLQLPDADLPLDPYLVGYLIGDGSLTQSMPKITCADAEGDQPWRDVLPAGMTVSQYERRAWACPQYGLRGSRWMHNEVIDGLRRCGLWGVTDEDTFIPHEYLWASERQRWALLQGLCDSDGHSHEAGGVEVPTVSEKLATGVVQLAQSLGGVAKVSTHQRRPGERTCYRVWVSLHQAEAPFRLRRKAERWKPRRVPYVRAFHSVEPVADAEAVCIKTDREDGLFLTEGMVVTHNTNFLILIKKGTEKHPAEQEEVDALSEGVHVLARLPVIVGDHRLAVEIVTPKLDTTLNEERYNVIDGRLRRRLFQTFGEDETPLEMGKVIAEGLESRRKMVRRSFEHRVIRLILAANPELASPRMRFRPRHIALAFDQAYASFMLEMRQTKELSRDTALGEFDFDQEEEAQLREVEAELYDDTFGTQVPFSTPADGAGATPGTKRAAGRQGGGLRNGGGAAPGSGQGKQARRPRRKSDG